MEPASFRSLSLQELALIVKGRYLPVQFAVIDPKLSYFKRVSNSLQELFEKLDEFLAESMLSSNHLDPAHQTLIDNRFRTLVHDEMNKKFGDDIRLVKNLDDIINTSKTLKEIRMRVQVEISNKKSPGQKQRGFIPLL